MVSDATPAPRVPCPRCDGALVGTIVRTAIWQGERMAVVQDIPAHTCTGCGEQFYDDDVSDALRKLNELGFPEGEARTTMVVPVFSLEGRIRKRGILPEDVHVD